MVQRGGKREIKSSLHFLREKPTLRGRNAFLDIVHHITRFFVLSTMLKKSTPKFSLKNQTQIQFVHEKSFN